MGVWVIGPMHSRNMLVQSSPYLLRLKAITAGFAEMESRRIQNLSYLICQRISRISRERRRADAAGKPVMLVNEIENPVIRSLMVDGIVARAIIAGSTERT